MKRRHDTKSEAGNVNKRMTHDNFLKWKHDQDRGCHSGAARAKQAMDELTLETCASDQSGRGPYVLLTVLVYTVHLSQSNARVHLRSFRTAQLEHIHRLDLAGENGEAIQSLGLRTCINS